MKYTLMLLAALLTACSMQNSGAKHHNTDVSKKEFAGKMQIKNMVKIGEPVELSFTVYNRTDTVARFLKWQTPFEPLLSKYLDITDEKGLEVVYKGPMAKRMMPPPAAAYISLKTQDSLNVKVDLLKGYDLKLPGKYTITYTSEGVSGLKVPQAVSFVYQ